MKKQNKIYQLTAFLLSILVLVLAIGTPMQVGTDCQCADVSLHHYTSIKETGAKSKINKRSCCNTKSQHFNKKQVCLSHTANVGSPEEATLGNNCCCSNKIQQAPSTILAESTHVVCNQSIDWLPTLLSSSKTSLLLVNTRFSNIDLLSINHGIQRNSPPLLTKQIILLVQSFLL